MQTVTNMRLGRNGDEPVICDIAVAREAVQADAAGIIDLALDQAGRKATFAAFETDLKSQVRALARGAGALPRGERAA